MSSITIDGMTITGNTDGLAAAYQRLCDAIDEGAPVTVNLAVVEKTQTRIYAFRVTSNTRVSAVLDFPEVGEIPAEHSIAIQIG